MHPQPGIQAIRWPRWCKMGCKSVSALPISLGGSVLDFERETTLNLDDIGVRQDAALS